MIGKYIIINENIKLMLDNAPVYCKYLSFMLV